VNVFIGQEKPRKLSLDRPPGEWMFERSFDQQLALCQVILSRSGEPAVFAHCKSAKRGFAEEIPSGPVWVDNPGIAGGNVLKRAPGFGPDRVVYAYSALHYPKWRMEFPLFAKGFHAGAFGEGFTLTSLHEGVVCIGDVIQVGSCQLQLSEPGHPDQWTYSGSRKKIVETAMRTVRTGWYYRVIEAGWVTAGDRAFLMERPNPSWSVRRCSQVLSREDPSRQDLAELSTLTGLASEWRWAARKALNNLEQSLKFFWGR
jgi:MOSC domain-containing protein YiiM